jgi:general secretion pathway protein J
MAYFMKFPHRKTRSSHHLPLTFDLTSRSDSGFTLLELLIAMTLLGFVAVMIFGALRFGTHAWQRSSAMTAQIDDVGVTQALLRRLVTEAYPMFIPDPGRPHIDFIGSVDQLTVLAPLPDAHEGGGLGRFTVFAQERNGRGEIDLAWRPELARQGDPSAEARVEPLLTGVTRLEIDYFGSARSSELPQWHDHWSDHAAMPSLVRIRVAFVENDSRIWPELVVAPRLTVDQSCLYDPVTRRCRGR